MRPSGAELSDTTVGGSFARTFYQDPIFHTHAAKVLPGEYFACERGTLMVTVLGSCVAACLRDPVTGIGGMNHFLLPDPGGSSLGAPTRYGTEAMSVLIRHLMLLGAAPERLEAKVFGGGAVMSALVSSQVGERNALFVREFLAREGIPIVAEDLLDVHPRKVYFFPRTGRALVRKLRQMNRETLIRRERLYEETLRRGVFASSPRGR